MKIKIILGDITKIKCDIIVNPTDRKLSGGGGVDGAIQKAAGEKYHAEKCQILKSEAFDLKQKPWVSSGGNLLAGNIIHICAPGWKGGEQGEKKELEACYQSALEAAEDVKCGATERGRRVVAFPSIATGANGFPVKIAAKIALASVNQFLFESWNRKTDTVLFVCSSEENRQIYQQVYEWIFGKGIPSAHRIRGSMLGGAIGDAMGYPIEFVRNNIPHMKDYQLKDGKALISDDTQMMLFTACGLMAGHTRAMMRGISGEAWMYIEIAYKEWLDTQKRPFDKKSLENREWKDGLSWISYIPELYSRRAPGNTCLSALELSKKGRKISSENPVNHSKGCGGVMRVAPIPLYMAAHRIREKTYVVKVCCEAAALTHGHPLGWLSAGALGCLLYDIMENFSLSYAVEDTIEFMQEHYGNYPETERLTELLNAAVCAADIRRKHGVEYAMGEPECECLGEGWVGEEALAIGLYGALAAVNRGFEDCILNSVTHKGDSDSTGMIAGNIYGAYFGDREIPEKWLGPLEHRKILEEISADMAQGCRIAEYENYRDIPWAMKYGKYVPCQKTSEAFTKFWYGEVGDGIQHITVPRAQFVPKENGGFRILTTEVSYWLEEGKIWHENAEEPDGWIKFEKTPYGWYQGFSFHLIYDPCYSKIYILNSDMARMGGNPWIGEITRNCMEVGSPIQITLTEDIELAVEMMISSEEFPYEI
ncbi:MAG: ADP-ribosylglycohydrolase family protein [Clostridiales bacterium]|nr:ADP-ribosylglycohydrolase family protein [Clostridiales bacterium]